MNVGPSESQFHPAIARVSVALICRSEGYKAAQTLALETLTDIACRYLRAIGDSAAGSANSGGRNECNLFDIVAALEDLGSVVGFVGAQKSRCLISSPVFKEIKGFVSSKNKCPFPHPIPKERWLQRKNGRNEMGLCHVPRWLPEMPALSRNGVALEMEIGEERRQVEEESMVQKERRKGCDLPEKRGKVKFRIGGGVANIETGNSGVFSTSRNGKRILCHGWNDGD